MENHFAIGFVSQVSLLFIKSHSIEIQHQLVQRADSYMLVKISPLFALEDKRRRGNKKQTTSSHPELESARLKSGDSIEKCLQTSSAAK